MIKRFFKALGSAILVVVAIVWVGYGFFLLAGVLKEVSETYPDFGAYAILTIMFVVLVKLFWELYS